MAIGLLVTVWEASTSPTANPRTWCPLDVSSEITAPTPGPTYNASPGAPAYFPNGSVVFSASASGCVPPYSFAYSFGDGAFSQEPSMVHVYPGPGYYSGSLTVEDSAGHESMSYFCVDAAGWPNLSVGSGNPAPPCP